MPTMIMRDDVVFAHMKIGDFDYELIQFPEMPAPLVMPINADTLCAKNIQQSDVTELVSKIDSGTVCDLCLTAMQVMSSVAG